MSLERPPEPLVRLVLDTSVFTNPYSARQFGETTEAALESFLELVERLRGEVRVYMPPLIFEELRTFLGDVPAPARFAALVALQAPNRYRLDVPGSLLYELIEDIRGRIDKGLRVAEKAVRDAHPENVEKSITRLREKYREALRAGLIDSREDVDLVLLALEQDAALISSDEGVVRWAERMGVRLIAPDNLRAVLEDLASTAARRQSMT